MPNLVVLESPYAGKCTAVIERNLRYVRACMSDCFKKGEYPFASHLLYTQPGILDDTIPEERELGIEAGLAWAKSSGAKHVVYTDLGISEGMQEGIERAKEEGRPVEFRTLGIVEKFLRFE